MRAYISSFHVSIPPHTPSVREDMTDAVYSTREEQREAALREIVDVVEEQRPVLVGTTNVEDAEAMADLCRRKHLEMVLLTAKHHAQEAQIIAEAGRPGRVTIAAQRLSQLGYANVAVYAGGKQEWEEAGLPFECPQTTAAA